MISRTGHFAMFQTVTAWWPSPIASPIAVATLPVSTMLSDAAVEDHAGRDRQQDPDRRDLPERPALRDLVDPVRCAHERADISGRRPQGTGDTDDDEDRRRTLAALLERLDRIVERVADATGRERDHVLDDRAGRVGAEDAQCRDEDEQAGEDGQHPVVGQRRGDVGEVVALEGAQRPPDDAAPGTLRSFGRFALCFVASAGCPATGPLPVNRPSSGVPSSAIALRTLGFIHPIERIDKSPRNRAGRGHRRDPPDVEPAWN